MIYLLWTLLNVILFLYFIYLLVGFIAMGRKVFRGKLMPVAIPVFVLGLVSIVAAAGPEKTNPSELEANVFNGQSETDYKRILLEENLSFDIGLAVEYFIKDGKVIPVETHSDLKGIVPGFEWSLVSFNPGEMQENGQVDFTAEGVLKWNLLGINIYSQPKSFVGKLL